MSPERLLLGGAAAIVVVSVVAAGVVPGALVPPDHGREGPGRLVVRDLAIASGEVTGATAELDVETRLAHVGPPANNLTVTFRAIDLESGLLTTTTTVAVPPIEGDREVPVNGTLRVPRSGGYRVEAIVYHDGRRLTSADRRVTGVSALEPPYAVSPVEFHRFRATDQPAIAYRIDSVENGSVGLAVTTYLTNAGDAPAGGLRLVLQARQADSGIVADGTAVTIGTIAPGRTATPEASLTVPDGYNYYLDAQLWADGVIVGTARAAANLNPTETLSVNRTRRTVGLEVSDFRSSREKRTAAPSGTAVASGGQPGFTVGLAVLALLALALWTRRGRR